MENIIGQYKCPDCGQTMSLTAAAVQEHITFCINKKAMKTLNDLLELLSTKGGSIVCSASLREDMVRQAQASDRMYVDENGIGFIWEPYIGRLPETDEELKEFERWYPLEIEMPEKLKTLDWFFERLKIDKQKKNN